MLGRAWEMTRCLVFCEGEPYGSGRWRPRKGSFALCKAKCHVPTELPSPIQLRAALSTSHAATMPCAGKHCNRFGLEDAWSSRHVSSTGKHLAVHLCTNNWAEKELKGAKQAGAK